ncbi:F-box protein At1g61340-like [Olea europaea var. sylvestris]|uniref:F-box protein At1g61340-like n=1 Tax=Olea europaea var. sylvestris TaxID=158386 RepID=UPI000C1D2505|nr:F-box protein At1g61340-like [Olea europaea var. sylvestris]
MAMGKKFESIVNRANEGYGMGLVRSTSFGRKRVALSHFNLEFDGHDDCILTTPAKRQCYEDSFFCSDKSILEALPQDVLIRILCGVEHDDLKRLVFVSKTLRDATLIAKQWHFAYSTPRKTIGFQNVGNLCEFNEVEAPNAPKQLRVPRSRLSAKKLADISVTLFSSGSEDNWARKDLLMAMETEI